ncbi:ABC transporter substrate-binding protein [Vibrio penaeicida]|uniref:ABC transporter substrate-binding protein n=1 Tax=Vibrio penaeicida TaxID=104609 RepID=UPI00191C7178|nr:ABC transporter substrate-binding protein [Vibrio penaeicida]
MLVRKHFLSRFMKLGSISSAVSLSCLLVAFGSTAGTIKVGMSTALEGPASGLGTNVKAGVESYFKMVNDAGGVNGNKLELIAINDGYEPGKAAKNTRALINDHKVVAMIGNVGTPTAVVTVPIANEMKVPLIGAVTGAGLLRQSPPDRYIINYRASYAQETAAMIDGLLGSGIKPEEIAFFTQKDGYGDAGYNGGVSALKSHGFTDIGSIAHGRYERNTTNVEDGLITVLDAEVEPKAIIMVGAYKPCAEFISLAQEELPDALFLNVSFVGSVSLMKELGEKSEGVIITQVVPHYEANLPTVNEFRSSLSSFNNSVPPSFLALEGYLAAKILVDGIKSKSGILNSEDIVNGIQSLSNFDLGIGTKNMLDATHHQASNDVWPTQIKGGQFVKLNWNEL